MQVARIVVMPVSLIEHPGIESVRVPCDDCGADCWLSVAMKGRIPDDCRPICLACVGGPTHAILAATTGNLEVLPEQYGDSDDPRYQEFVRFLDILSQEGQRRNRGEKP